MDLWKQLRILFLAVILGSVVFVFVKVLQTKSVSQPKSEESRLKVSDALLVEDNISMVLPLGGNHDIL